MIAAAGLLSSQLHEHLIDGGVTLGQPLLLLGRGLGFDVPNAPDDVVADTGMLANLNAGVSKRIQDSQWF